MTEWAGAACDCVCVCVCVFVALCVARAALQFYRRTDDVSNDMEEMDTECQQQQQQQDSAAAGDTDKSMADKPFTLAQLLRSAGLRRPLFVACMLQVIQQFSGINAVRLYASSHSTL